MRIAFDLDGVLADLHASYVQTAVRLFPELDRTVIGTPDVGASAPDEKEGAEGSEPGGEKSGGVPRAVSRRQSQAIWNALRSVEDFWQGLTEIESGGIARLAALSEERRWEVLFITSRPKSRGATVQRQSQRWLEAKGFPLPSVYVVHGSRGRIAQALDLDVVVDDRPENCLDVALESKAEAILLWRGPQASVPSSAKRLGIAVAPSLHACLDALVEAQAGQVEGALLDRLRRLFGLRGRSAT